MCHKLLQVYACGHTKPVCTTPCPHALKTSVKTAQQTSDHYPTDDDSPDNDIALSALLDELLASSTRNVDSQPQPASQLQVQHQQLLHRQPSPVQTQHWERSDEEQDDRPPAFRLLVPDQDVTMPPSPPPQQYSPVSPTSLTLPNSPTHLYRSHSQHQVAHTRTAAHTFDGDNHDNDDELSEPNLCDYYFPHYLPRSRRPCLQCYMQPEWAVQRSMWMRAYSQTHFGESPEIVERMSGIQRLRELSAEQHGDEDVRRRVT